MDDRSGNQEADTPVEPKSLTHRSPSDPLRYIIDTNIYISALWKPQGTAGELLRKISEGKVTPIYSGRIIEELRDVALRPEIRDRGIAPEDVEMLIDILMLVGEFYRDLPPGHAVPVCGDPKDDFLFALADLAAPDLLVSNDNLVIQTLVPGVLATTCGIPFIYYSNNIPGAPATYRSPGNRPSSFLKFPVATSSTRWRPIFSD